MSITEKTKLERFIELRNQYIDLLNEKKITKLEFNYLNNEIFNIINLRPFTVLNCFEEALYNYNYYNSKAKISLQEEKNFRSKKDSRSQKRAKQHENNKLNYYSHKDEAIHKMVEIEDSKYIEAYYIEMKSKNLNNLIFEINFKNREKVILHTKNEEVKKLLIKKSVFLDEIRVSLIDSYINK